MGLGIKTVALVPFEDTIDKGGRGEVFAGALAAAHIWPRERSTCSK